MLRQRYADLLFCHKRSAQRTLRWKSEIQPSLCAPAGECPCHRRSSEHLDAPSALSAALRARWCLARRETVTRCKAAAVAGPSCGCGWLIWHDKCNNPARKSKCVCQTLNISKLFQKIASIGLAVLLMTHRSLSIAFFSPFSSLNWSRELWCQPSGVNNISLAFSSTRRLNKDSADTAKKRKPLNK